MTLRAAGSRLSLDHWLEAYPGYAYISGPMSQKERTNRYKAMGAGTGLVRVEVLVPPEGRTVILDEARKLRAQARGKEELSPEAIALHDEALVRFKTQCFWNSNPSKTRDGLEAVCQQLRTYGDMSAWRLAAKIRGVLSNAN